MNFDEDDRMRMQREAEDRVSPCFDSMVADGWREFVCVLSRQRRDGVMRGVVFGCGHATRLIGCSELDVAAAPLFLVSGTPGEVFHIPLHVHRDVAHAGIDRTSHASTPILDGDYRWGSLISTLERTAAQRAQEGIGPPEQSLDLCEALMKSHDSDCPGDRVRVTAEIAEAVSLVLGQGRRALPQRLTAGVILIRRSQCHARGVVTAHGDFYDAEASRLLCRTGAASAAATYIATIEADPTHAWRTTFIPFVRRDAEFQWTITRDPMIALRHIYATEPLRLRSHGRSKSD